MDWEKEHERAMNDPRVRGEEADAASPQGITAGEDDLAEDTTSARHSEFPPNIGARTEIGGGAETQEALDAEYRGS